MFSKYISKITNTIGTVNYLQQKSRKSQQQEYSDSRRSSKASTQLLFDGGYDVEYIDPDTINRMDIDLSFNGSRKNSLNDDFAPHSQIILSEAIAKLRNTLFCYSLVPICILFIWFWFGFCFCFKAAFLSGRKFFVFFFLFIEIPRKSVSNERNNRNQYALKIHENGIITHFGAVCVWICELCFNVHFEFNQIENQIGFKTKAYRLISKNRHLLALEFEFIAIFSIRKAFDAKIRRFIWISVWRVHMCVCSL